MARTCIVLLTQAGGLGNFRRLITPEDPPMTMARTSERNAAALSPPCEGGARGGEGRHTPVIRSTRHAQTNATPPRLSPPCKGGARGGGRMRCRSRAADPFHHSTHKRTQPRALPPLAKGGRGGEGRHPPVIRSTRPPALRLVDRTNSKLDSVGIPAGWTSRLAHRRFLQILTVVPLSAPLLPRICGICPRGFQSR